MLDKIVKHKYDRMAGLDFTNNIVAIEQALPSFAPVRSLRAGLTEDSRISVIAEIKRRSPSRGELAPDLSIRQTAEVYERGGAKGMSVLTDHSFFGGSIDDLMTARHCSPLPVLRKDFIIHEYQVWESRLIGADAILLIAAILNPATFRQLYTLACSIGLEILVEVHSEKEIDMVGAVAPEIIGINNRDLRTFKVDISTTERLRKHIPEHVTCISESGIKNRADMERLQACGVDAALIGESLVTNDDPAGKIRELTGANNDPS